MSYFNTLGLTKEPFSTSPDPAFFYLSGKHKAALYKLRIAIKLKRGLSVIAGNVGAGKTTLARRLLQILKTEDEDRDNILFHIMLNPISSSEREFLLYLTHLFQITLNSKRPSAIDCIRSIEEYLFQKGVKEGKTIVLLIDEAQKLSPSCLEILRVLLNYETNEYKILQLILLGQKELLDKMKKIENLWDRISLKYLIHPLDKDETKEMINFRLKKASYNDAAPSLFEEGAMETIYNHSQGYPRKITMLCHNALEFLVMEKRPVIDNDLLCEVVEKEESLITL